MVYVWMYGCGLYMAFLLKSKNIYHDKLSLILMWTLFMHKYLKKIVGKEVKRWKVEVLILWTIANEHL